MLNSLTSRERRGASICPEWRQALQEPWLSGRFDCFWGRTSADSRSPSYAASCDVYGWRRAFQETGSSSVKQLNWNGVQTHWGSGRGNLIHRGCDAYSLELRIPGRHRSRIRIGVSRFTPRRHAAINGPHDVVSDRLAARRFKISQSWIVKTSPLLCGTWRLHRSPPKSRILLGLYSNGCCSVAL